jgi:hypothetical protein
MKRLHWRINVRYDEKLKLGNVRFGLYLWSVSSISVGSLYLWVLHFIIVYKGVKPMLFCQFFTHINSMLFPTNYVSTIEDWNLIENST